MDISVPTIVPSLVVGTTSTVTTFKEPPKNKEAMFDFAVAGPLAGVLASIVALVIGSQLTLISDPATLPALPLEILRQSTLGGGIIDGIIQGSLYIPDGAPMTGIMISLHPLAMAGYISLIINALALVPVGSKFASVKSFWLFCWLC
jgi:membrane-associated protease RseP (regulator of RpoE activity)